MTPDTSSVNSRKRQYDISRRQERALRTQQEVVTVARRRFLEFGYAHATLAGIADEAGVSVDTIYKTFGGKPGLVRAIADQAMRGDRAVAPYIRADQLSATEPDPRKIVRGWGKLAAEVTPRVAPITLLVRSAAMTDHAMASLQTELSQQRLRRMTHNAGALDRGGHLRRGLSVRRAGEILWTYTAAEFYELLVMERGWSNASYGRFLGDAFTSALLDGSS